MTTLEDWPASVALPGVVSEGTMRVEDLIPAFAKVLKELDPAGYNSSEYYCRDCLNAYPESHQFGDLANPDEGYDSLRQQVLATLIEGLEQAAPEGYYFGTTEGDGACFGFFENHGEYVDPDSQSHMGTLTGYALVCACGDSFPAYRHPYERDHWDSPGWEAHVKKHLVKVAN